MSIVFISGGKEVSFPSTFWTLRSGDDIAIIDACQLSSCSCTEDIKATFTVEIELRVRSGSYDDSYNANFSTT